MTVVKVVPFSLRKQAEDITSHGAHSWTKMVRAITLHAT